MAFVYPTDSCARPSAAGGDQEVDGMAPFQTFTQAAVLSVSGFQMGVPSTAVALVARRDGEDK